MKPHHYALAATCSAWAITFLWAILTPEPSWFDYHHSYNEHWYSSLLRGDIVSDRLPPGFTILGSAVPFSWFPEVVGLRLISLLSCVSLIVVIWKVRGPRHAALVASLPWVLVWGSRAQTDMLAATLCWTGLLLAMESKTFLGGLLVGLSSFVKPTGLLATTNLKPRFLLGVILGCIPFAIWFFQTGVASLGFHANHGIPGGNVIGNAFGLVAGMGGVWLLIAKANWLDAKNRTLAVATLLFVLFAIVKAPLAHQYYLLPGVIGMALLARTEGRHFWWMVAANSFLGLYLVAWLATPGGKSILMEAFLTVVILAGILVTKISLAPPRISQPLGNLEADR